MDVSSSNLRNVMGTFATGVTIVTLQRGDIDHGMTVNSFTSLSLDPPLILFNAARSTNTHDLVQKSESFAVNILTHEQKWISDRFAGEHHELEDPFHDIPFFRAETGSPVIKNTLGYIDCTLTESHGGGDHTIYVGEVEDLEVQNENADPLIFYKGAFGTIGGSE